jgi:hypothetical protein
LHTPKAKGSLTTFARSSKAREAREAKDATFVLIFTFASFAFALPFAFALHSQKQRCSKKQRLRNEKQMLKIRIKTLAPRYPPGEQARVTTFLLDSPLPLLPLRCIAKSKG